MKKLIYLLILLLTFPCTAFAKTYTFPEDSVKVVGIDIPEGNYIVSSHKNNAGFCAVYLFDDLNYNNKKDTNDETLLYLTVTHPENPYYKQGEALNEYRLKLIDGMSIEMLVGIAIFTPDDEATLSPIDFANDLRNMSLADLRIVEQEVYVAIKKAEAHAKNELSPNSTPTPIYSKLNYERAARLPESYMDQKVSFSGKVVQVMGSRSEGYTIRIATKGDYDDIVYLTIPPESTPSVNILEGDKLGVKATFKGDYTYSSIWGNEVTIPSVIADSISISISGGNRAAEITYNDDSVDRYVEYPEGTIFAVVTKGVNIRSEASANSEKIGSAVPGEKFVVTQAYYTEKWHEIEFNGTICYISANYVKLKE